MQAVAEFDFEHEQPFELTRRKRASVPSPSALAACGVALVVVAALLGAESCTGLDGEPAFEAAPSAARMAAP